VCPSHSATDGLRWIEFVVVTMTDRSLDDFVPDSESSEDSDTDENAAPGDDIEPAVATSTLSPDGAPCESCGETVRRRWRDGEASVCRDCKEW
jgi:hypothetical protein